MKKPLVTVAITLYNGADLIARALESSIHQTYSNLEILVLDDASKDNTEEVVREFCKKDSRIRYVRNEANIGYARSLQKVAELARGEYVQLLGADDWFAQNYIEVAVDEFHADPTASCVVTKMIFLRDVGEGRFDFISSFYPKKRFAVTDYYIKNVYKTVSDLNITTLTSLALFRREDFLEGITFMNDAFDDPAVKIPPELRTLHFKGFATDTLFLLKSIGRYDHYVLTDKTAYIKIEYAVQEKKPYNSKGLEWVSASGILRWFYFNRLAYEYLYRTDYKKHFGKFHRYFAAELLVSMVVVWMRSEQKKSFFSDLRFEDVKAYFAGYPLWELALVFCRIPSLFLVRVRSFLGRILRGRDRTIVNGRADYFLDGEGFFRVG